MKNLWTSNPGETQIMIDRANSPTKAALIWNVETLSDVVKRNYEKGLLTPKQYADDMRRGWLYVYEKICEIEAIEEKKETKPEIKAELAKSEAVTKKVAEDLNNILHT